MGKSEAPAFDKYDDKIPAALLREGYSVDRLAPDEVMTFFLPDAIGQKEERGEKNG